MTPRGLWTRCLVKPGDVYGYLVVLEMFSGADAEREPGKGKWARVRCVCGKRKMVRARHLRLIKSCGCKMAELAGQASRRFWVRWRNERRRCA